MHRRAVDEVIQLCYFVGTQGCGPVGYLADDVNPGCICKVLKWLGYVDHRSCLRVYEHQLILSYIVVHIFDSYSEVLVSAQPDGGELEVEVTGIAVIGEKILVNRIRGDNFTLIIQ